MRCLLPAFYRGREAEFRPRRFYASYQMTEALRQERKILASDHTPIMGWLFRSLSQDLVWAQRPMSMIHQDFVHGTDDPESRRDLPHPNHRSSVFNALMTYACCARM